MKTIQHLDMSAYLEAYTQQVKAEAREADRIRAAVAAGAPRPVPTTVWEISDRH